MHTAPIARVKCP